MNFQLGSPSDCDELQAMAGRCGVVKHKVNHSDILKEANQPLVGAFDIVISQNLIAHIGKTITTALDRSTPE